MDTEAYLERINSYGSLAPTAETLRELQVAHLLAVPFENLSIHLKQPIVLETNAVFTKVVERRRGGFCYELLIFKILHSRGQSISSVKVTSLCSS